MKPSKPPARMKRVWTVADFAMHAFKEDGIPACRRARRLLAKLNAKHKGALLIPSQGTNREYTFFVAVLCRLEPDLFKPIESVEFRLEAVEEDVGDLRATSRRTIAQVGHVTREVAKLRRRGAA